MKPWRRYLNYAVYRKMLLSYIILIAITISLISATLFSLFSSRITNEIVNTSQSMLTQTSYTSDLIYERVTAIGNTLLNNNHVINVMFSRETDRLQEYRTMQLLHQLQSTYPFVKYISIYNEYTDRYMGTRGFSPAIQDELTTHIQNNQEKTYLEFIPRRLESPYSSNARIYSDVLSFILYPGYSLSLPSRGAIIIDVNEQYINDIMISIQNKTDNIFITDEQGTVLSHTEKDQFLSDYSLQSYIYNTLQTTELNGHFTTLIDGRKHLVVFVKSDNLSWYFFNIRPYDQMFLTMNQLRSITLSIAFILILVGIVLAFWLSKNIYNPLGTLIQRISSLNPSSTSVSTTQNEVALLSDTLQQYLEKTTRLESYVEDSSPVLRETHLRSLIKGNITESEKVEQTLDALNPYLLGPNYSVLVLKLDDYDQFIKKYNSKDRDLYRFALYNAVHELLGAFSQADLVIMEEDEITFLLQHKQESIVNQIHLALDEAHQVMKNNFKLSFSSGIGDPIVSCQFLPQSYAAAQEYVNYRLFYGHGSIIDGKKAHKVNLEEIKYPHAIEKKIIEAIQLNNIQAIKEEIAAFKKSLNPMNCYHTLTYCNLLAFSILKHFDTSSHATLGGDLKDYYRLLKRISNLDTLDTIIAVIQNLCLQICENLDDARSHKNVQLVEQIQDYIRTHFAIQDLSIDKMAEKVQLSSGYIGKLFKSTTQMNFNDYVNQIRMEKAQELLRTTKDSVSQISEKVGIANSSYFYTLFKKTYGFTPIQYRNQALSRVNKMDIQ